MLLLVLVLLGGIGVSIWVVVEEEDFAYLIVGIIATFAAELVAVLIVCGITACLPEKNLFFEVTSSEPIVVMQGEYITETVDEKNNEYYSVWMVTDKGIHELSVSCSKAYMVYDDDPRIELTECVGFRKAKYYIYAVPQFRSDYYTIYLPEPDSAA